jgi:GR25 family glycosyltransferase involved in LPS biosynthesis
MEVLKHSLYINLDHRTDRLISVKNELKTIGIEHAERFSAIKMPMGNVGCTISHIKCLELAKQNDWPFVFICEDDIHFTNPQMFTDSLNKFINFNTHWDVLVLGGNNCPPFYPVNDFCIRVHNVQTTTGYIVRNNYYDTLIDNYKYGLQSLLREPEKKNIFSIDIHWKILQKRDLWYLLIPLTIIQNYDYSDIEHRVTDYSKMMLDLDKKQYFKKFDNNKSNNFFNMNLT